jgi:hypothetical protein
MPLAFWFWLVFLLIILFTVRPWYDARPGWWVMGGWFWWWICVAILGWQVFGNPFHALVH